MSIANYLETAWLRTIRGGEAGTTYAAPRDIYVKLHRGDPGEAGTANAATETDRVRITFAEPSAEAGTMDSSNEQLWREVAATETYSHISLWDRETEGNCLYTGALTESRSVTAGDNFTLPTGRVQVTLG